MSKVKEMWILLRAKHYAVLVANSEEEIGWAIETLRTADEKARA